MVLPCRQGCPITSTTLLQITQSGKAASPFLFLHVFQHRRDSGSEGLLTFRHVCVDKLKLDSNTKRAAQCGSRPQNLKQIEALVASTGAKEANMGHLDGRQGTLGKWCRS